MARIFYWIVEEDNFIYINGSLRLVVMIVIFMTRQYCTPGHRWHNSKFAELVQKYIFKYEHYLWSCAGVNKKMGVWGLLSFENSQQCMRKRAKQVFFFTTFSPYPQPHEISGSNSAQHSIAIPLPTLSFFNKWAYSER